MQCVHGGYPGSAIVLRRLKAHLIGKRGQNNTPRVCFWKDNRQMAAFTTAPAQPLPKFNLPLRAWFAAFSDWQRIRSAELELNRASDHVLEDIGISRSEILEAVRTGRR